MSAISHKKGLCNDSWYKFPGRMETLYKKDVVFLGEFDPVKDIQRGKVLNIYNPVLSKCIDYIIRILDQNRILFSSNIIYVNNSIPNKLFNSVNMSWVDFRNQPDLLDRIHYFKVSNVVEVRDIIEKEGQNSIVIIESLDQIVNWTDIDYNELNLITNRVLLSLQKFRFSALLSNSFNTYINYFVHKICDI